MNAVAPAASASTDATSTPASRTDAASARPPGGLRKERASKGRSAPAMARPKRPHKTSPKTPSRVKKRRATKKRTRSHHRPELVGLGLAGLGVLLAAVLWFGFNGGPVAHVVTGGLGAAAYLTPLVLVPLGVLIVARSALVDLRPFRLGLAVTIAGLMLTLGRPHGGLLGRGLESLAALGLGTTGARILGVLLALAGGL